MRWNRKLERRAGALAFRFLIRRFSAKSGKQAEASGARIGRIVFRRSKKRREIAIRNIGLAFPGKTEQEREALALKTFEHFGIVMSDFARTAGRPKEEILGMEVEGLEHVKRALEEGRGAILITGHFGNWERMGNWFAANGYKLSVVVRDANAEDMNEEVVKIRQAAGLEVISRGTAARGVLTKLKRNELVGILPDQNSGDAFIPFFGKPCGTVLGPAVLAARAGSPMIPTFCYRTGSCTYRLEIWPPLEPDPTHDEPSEAMMRSVNAALEKAITAHPEQYLWLHDRWKAARQKGLL